MVLICTPITDVIDSAADFVTALRRLDDSELATSLNYVGSTSFHIEKLIDIINTDVSKILLEYK